MDIDQQAPLVTCQEILVEAPIEKVWTLLTNIERWPAWQPGISSAKLEGRLAEGSVFRWKANGLSIVSTIRDLEVGRRIGWTGVALGTKAVHIWYLEPHEQGTQVRVEESLSGWLSRLMKLVMPRFLEKSMEQSLSTLKSYVERH